MSKIKLLLRNKLLLAASLNLLVSLLMAYLIGHSNFFFMEPIEKGIINLSYRIRGAILPKHVVIVAIDDKSLANIGRWPWTRKTIASLINQISLQNPNTIAINMLFLKDTSNSSDDLVLQETVAKKDRVVLLSSLDDANFRDFFLEKMKYQIYLRNNLDTHYLFEIKREMKLVLT